MSLLSRVKTWITGETLTASDLNAEFDNILNGMTPTYIEDASADNTAMRATADPYPASSESLATSLLGEIQRIRFQLNQIVGKTYWYEDPSANLGGVPPSGAILLWTTDTAPTGWLLCYGQAVSRTTYAALFAVIGETYGAGDASTTFNLPDLRGRFPLGKDNMGGSSANRVTDSDADTLGGADGDELKDLSHTHTGPSHTHSVAIPGDGYSLDGPGTTGGELWITNTGNSHYYDLDRSVTSGSGGTGATGSAGSSTQDVMPPFITLNYIIKY